MSCTAQSCFAALVALGCAAPLTAAAAEAADHGYQVLHHFTGEQGTGSLPQGPLVQGADGALYGTTRDGGEWSGGDVFRSTLAGEVTLLHSFRKPGPGGESPYAGLAWGKGGKLYGTTYDGGKFSLGTAFRITTDGVLKVLHNFARQGDGAGPATGLLLASDGNFYGTTWTASDSPCCGTVYRLDTDGVYTLVLDFVSNEGNFPSDLIQGSDGKLYGTTSWGGDNARGTVFRMTLDGVAEVLHAFSEGDGAPHSPQAALVQAADGNYYGTTGSGGAGDYGTVFRMTPAGEVTVLHSFVRSDGAEPSTPLIQARNGNFYGTTYNGGAHGLGTIFRMNADGTVVTLHSFKDLDGVHPCSSLMQAADGMLYGVACEGGKRNKGTLYRLKAK